MVSCPTKHREQTQGRVFRVIDYYVTLDDRCQRPAVKLSDVPFGTILSCPHPPYRNLLDFNETTLWYPRN